MIFFQRYERKSICESGYGYGIYTRFRHLLHGKQAYTLNNFIFVQNTIYFLIFTDLKVVCISISYHDKNIYWGFMMCYHLDKKDSIIDNTYFLANSFTNSYEFAHLWEKLNVFFGCVSIMRKTSKEASNLDV